MPAKLLLHSILVAAGVFYNILAIGDVRLWKQRQLGAEKRRGNRASAVFGRKKGGNGREGEEKSCVFCFALPRSSLALIDVKSPAEHYCDVGSTCERRADSKDDENTSESETQSTARWKRRKKTHLLLKKKNSPSPSKKKTPRQVSIVRQGARPPVSIATNEMSRRRSAAAVAFVPAPATTGKKGGAAPAVPLSSRLLGDDAAAAATRRPEAAVLRLRDVLVLLSPNSSSSSSPDALFPPSSPSWPLTLAVAEEEEIPGGGLALSVGGSASASAFAKKNPKQSPPPSVELHSPEELAGAVLRYAQRVATAAAAEGLPAAKKDPRTGKKESLPVVVDCVLTVPPSLPPSARAALLDGASAAGINVLSLVSTPAAVSLAYGIERRFEEAGKGSNGNKKSGGGGSGDASSSSSALAPQLLVIYDQGSTHTSAALVKFSAYREPAKRGQSALSAQSVSQFEILDLAWDDSLGSDALDEALLEHFAAEFRAQSGRDLLLAGGGGGGGAGGGDPLSKPAASRALARLRKAVRRTKEVLSANGDAPCSVEELLDGKDFRSSIDRKAFEKLAGGHFARSAAPLAALLAGNGVRASDLAAVELVGGGTRVPGLQAALSKALGDRPLDRHLDADEAAAHGAALFAANASTAFRLRRFGGGDAAPFAQLLATTVLDSGGRAISAESAAGAPLLPFGKRLPVKRVVKLPGAVEGVNDALSGVGEAGSAGGGGGGGGGTGGGVFGSKKKKKGASPAATLAPVKKAPASQLLAPEADGWLLRVSYDPASRRGPPRGVSESDPTVGTWRVSGLAKATASLDAAALAKRARASGLTNSRLVSVLGPARVEVHFRSAADARMEPRRAELIAEFEEEFEVEVAVKEEKKKKEKEEDKREKKGDGGGDASKNSASSSDNSTSASSSPSPAPAPAPATTTTKTKTEKRTRKRTARALLDLTPFPGLRQPRASEKRLAAAKAALALFDAADAEAAAAAAAKNELEAFIISLRARLDAANDDSSSENSGGGGLEVEGGGEAEEDDAATLRAVSSPGERGSLHSSLTEAEDWLYDEGDGEGAAAFEAKLRSLEGAAEGILSRASERWALPKALARARKAAERAAADARSWKEKEGGKDARPWLPAREVDALAASAASLEKFAEREGAAQLKAKDATKAPELTSAAVEEKVAALEAQRLALASVKKPAPPKEETRKEGEEAAKKEGEKGIEEEEGGPSPDASSPPPSSDGKEQPKLERESGGGDDPSSSDDGHDEL